MKLTIIALGVGLFANMAMAGCCTTATGVCCQDRCVSQCSGMTSEDNLIEKKLSKKNKNSEHKECLDKEGMAFKL